MKGNGKMNQVSIFKYIFSLHFSYCGRARLQFSLLSGVIISLFLFHMKHDPFITNVDQAQKSLNTNITMFSSMGFLV